MQDVAFHFDLTRRSQARLSLAQINPGFSDIAVAIATTNGVDRTFNALDHRWPIDADVVDHNAESVAGASLMQQSCCPAQGLRWITAGVEARPSDLPALGHGHASPLRTGLECSGASGCSGADDDHVVGRDSTRRHAVSF